MSIELKTSVGVEESIHGIAVKDPYRWLEERDCPATDRWLDDQHNRYADYFRKLGSLGSLRDHVRAFLDAEAIDQVGKVRDLYFYRKRVAGDATAIHLCDDLQRSRSQAPGWHLH
jgi:prolyl oligopeptidase